MNNLILIDGYSLLFRAYYATAYKGEDTILRTSNGTAINAIFTFANMVMPLVNNLSEGDGIIVCLDTGKKTYRHEVFSDYKGTRPPCPESLKIQMPILREFLSSYNIPFIEIDGYEADDVAGTLAFEYSKNFNVSIFTSDHDYLQLVKERVSINLMKKGMKDIQIVNINNFESLFNMKPHQIRDLKGLFGDSSDNLKGVTGVGEKTALSLIEKYETIENVYEHIDDFKGKMKEHLIEDKDVALMCKNLATIQTNVPLDFSTIIPIYNGYDYETMFNFINKYELKSLLSKINKTQIKTQNSNQQSFTKAEYLELPNEKYLGFAVIFDNSNYKKSKIEGFALSYNNKNFYITLEDALNDSNFKLILESNEYLKCLNDSKATRYALNRIGFKLNGIYLDLGLATYILDSNVGSNFDMILGFYKEMPTLSEDIIEIKIDEAEKCLKLKDEAFNQLKNNDGLSIYNNIELPLSNVLFNMELEGIPVSKQVLLDFKKQYLDNLSNIEKEIYRLAGEEFNIASPKQVSAILFDKLGLKSNRHSSTSIDYLKYLIEDHPIVPLILEYRKYAKLLGTYVNGLIDHIWEDGKIHCNFNQISTTTGRLSSSNPNMQNIAVREEDSKEIRKAFFYNNVNQYKLLSFDYSQIELRILASLSNCQKLIDAFNNDVDVHTLTAQNIFNKQDISANERRQAKAVNFGIVYGISDYGLKEQINVPVYEAKNIINKFYEAYPEIKDYLNSMIQKAKETGFAETYFGRRRYLPELNSSEYLRREFAKRAAMNAPIQGTAADIIKTVMIKIDELLKNYDSKMILQIHDELIFKMNTKEIDELIPQIKKIMEDTFTFSVKLKVDGGVSDDWYGIK